MKPSKLLIVDPFASAGYLSAAFREYGFHCTALYTAVASRMPDYLKPPRDYFDTQIWVDSDDLEVICQHIDPTQYDCVINGFEGSTALTDAISQRFFPQYANDPATSILRSDKFEMQEALKRAGLPYIKQKKIAAPFSWNNVAQELGGFSYPVFCKPAFGYATVGAFRVDEPSVFNTLADNAAAEESRNYLVQEFVHGTEYIIDTFSAAGQHHICAVLRYSKKMVDGAPLYRTIEVERDPEIWQQCVDYVQRLLPALDYQFGFSHIEVFITGDGQIKLVELNNRVSGARGTIARLTDLSGFTTQPAALRNLLEGRPNLEGIRSETIARSLFLFKFTEGAICDPSHKLSDFSTVKDVIMFQPVNGLIKYDNPPTLLDTVCVTVLHGDDEIEIDRQTSAIFELEAANELV